jgi:CRP-like cAMP-binding protein
VVVNTFTAGDFFGEISFVATAASLMEQDAAGVWVCCGDVGLGFRVCGSPNLEVLHASNAQTHHHNTRMCSLIQCAHTRMCPLIQRTLNFLNPQPQTHADRKVRRTANVVAREHSRCLELKVTDLFDVYGQDTEGLDALLRCVR